MSSKLMKRLRPAKAIPSMLHDNVVAEIDVSRYKNMRDLNKKIKDTFVSLIKT